MCVPFVCRHVYPSSQVSVHGMLFGGRREEEGSRTVKKEMLACLRWANSSLAPKILCHACTYMANYVVD